MPDTGEIESNKAKGKSRVTNGLTLLLTGDGRTAGARRFRDLFNAFAAELGDAAKVPSNNQLLRRIAQVSIELEALEAKRAQGDAIDPLGFCTLVNSQRRLLRDLEAAKARSAKPPQTLAEYLASERKTRATLDKAA